MALSNLGMRIQESFSEHTRDLTFVGRSPNAAYFDTGDDKVKNIRRQLDSTHERDILEGMKRLVALISKGRNVSEFFAQVVKNVGSHNLEIRKLVYIYLLRYADAEPDLALLSINTFQKDLTDSNPLIRAMALRVLSGIRVPMIGTIVVLGIKKCASDLSPYVRKAAALAIPKCYDLDTTHLPSLLPIITTLLADRSPLSIGATAIAFNAVCPNRLDLLHQQYRRLCRILTDADEWGQVPLLQLLGRYALTMLSAPANAAESETGNMDKDLKLLLDSAEPLLQSRNPAVVMAVFRTFYYLGPPSTRGKIIAPLLALMNRSPEVERVVLKNCISISSNHPDLLEKHFLRFFVRETDLPPTKQAKVQILTNLANSNNVNLLIQEFKDYALDVDDVLVSESLHALGRCARKIPEAHEKCLSALMTFIKSKHDTTISTAILVLKSIYQHQHQNPSSHAGPSSNKIIAGLARKFDDINQPIARACVIWLVGQYAAVQEGDPSATVVPGMEDWAPDVLRRCAKAFANESDPLVRMQTLTLAAKLLSLSPSSRIIQLLATYVFTQARFDASYDVRDRSRMLVGLLRGLSPNLDGAETGGEDEGEEVGDVWEARKSGLESGGGVTLRVEQARAILFQGKALGDDQKDISSTDPPPRTLGTMSLVIERSITQLAASSFGGSDWLEKGTDPSLRDSPDDTRPSTAPAPRIQGFGNGGVGSGSRAATPGPPAGTIRGGSPIGPRTPTPVVLTPGAGTSGTTGEGKKWKDLDSFYAEDDEEEEEEEEEGEGEGDGDGSGDEGSESGEEESEHGEDVHERERPSPRAPTPVLVPGKVARGFYDEEDDDEEEEEEDEDPRREESYPTRQTTSLAEDDLAAQWR